MATTKLPDVTADDVLAAVRTLVVAHDERRVSTQLLALSQLLSVARAMPPDLRHRPIAPADAIERDVNKDGLRYVVMIDGGFIGFRLWDVIGDNAMAHLELAAAKQLVGDLLAVIAAKESSHG